MSLLPRPGAALLALALTLTLTIRTAPTSAQLPPVMDDVWSVTSSINAGAMWFDLEERGVVPFFAFRTDYVVSDLGVAEFALGYGQPEQDAGRSHFAVMEAQYQIRWPMMGMAPYFGLGGGVHRDEPIDDEEREVEWNPTFSVGLGFRSWLDDRTQIRLDVRGRSIGAALTRSSLEATLGLGWQW